jgi:hypothetical protein
VDFERQQGGRPVPGSGPGRDGVEDCEIEQLASRVLAGEMALGLDRFSQLPVESFYGICIRYERHQMPPRPATGLLQLLSVSGSGSTVRPSGSRGIRERTQAGQAVLIRCALSAG